MKKPAERDYLATVPGYTGQTAKIYLQRDDAEKITGLEIFDLLGHSKMTGDVTAAAAWVAAWLEQEAANRRARRTQLQAQLFFCKLGDDEKALFFEAQKALEQVLQAAGVRSRLVAATSGAARPTLGPAVKRR